MTVAQSDILREVQGARRGVLAGRASEEENPPWMSMSCFLVAHSFSTHRPPPQAISSHIPSQAGVDFSPAGPRVSQGFRKRSGPMETSGFQLQTGLERGGECHLCLIEISMEIMETMVTDDINTQESSSGLFILFIF